MGSFVLAIDQGTTGTTAQVCGEGGVPLGLCNVPFRQHFPESGWVEHDLDEVWSSVLSAISKVLEQVGVSSRDCVALGVTNQRETTVVWDAETGEPIHRAIVWQDRRTATRCQELRAHRDALREKTGLELDPYFSATKIEWILDHVSGARARGEQGKLRFGTIDCWLLSRLSGGCAFRTDPSNACRTLLYDLHTGTWSQELAELFRVPWNMLPEIGDTMSTHGVTKGVLGLPDGIPITALVGDQQSALYAQTRFEPSMGKCTYGTGAFFLMNTGETPVASKTGLLTTVAGRVAGKTTFALEGSVFVAGAAVQWLRDGLGIIEEAAEVESLAKQVASSAPVVFVPALTGLGAPEWDPDARGAIFGIGRETTKAHLARATLEGIAQQVADLSGAMEEDASAPLRRLRVDGGASRNDLLLQIQADVLGVPVDRPKVIEVTALGAGLLAGQAVGFFDSPSEASSDAEVVRTFEPSLGKNQRQESRANWRAALERAKRGWRATS